MKYKKMSRSAPVSLILSSISFSHNSLRHHLQLIVLAFASDLWIIDESFVILEDLFHGEFSVFVIVNFLHHGWRLLVWHILIWEEPSFELANLEFTVFVGIVGIIEVLL